MRADARFCPSDGTPLDDLTDPAQSLVGRTVAERFEVTGKLGEGGMGEVYLATQLGTNRPCALKILKPAKDWDPSVVARFHREAANASRVSHPNVAHVYDSGEADGVMFIAMEYVKGESLAHLLARERTLGPRRTARIVWQCANGLAAAHELGTVHRDLKPANIMLTSYRQWSDFVKIVDFGIAKGGTAPEAEAVTSASVVVGTPQYMAPEQFLSRDPEPRSDVYSLALTAVHCLTGSLPPTVGLAVLVPNDDPDNPAGLMELAAVGSWPAPMLACIRRALAWKPADRYPSVEAFAADFARAATDWEPATGDAREPWEARLDHSDRRETGPAPVAAPAATEPLLPTLPSPVDPPRWRTLAIGGGIAVVAAVGWLLLRSSPTESAGPVEPAPAAVSPTPAPPIEADSGETRRPEDSTPARDTTPPDPRPAFVVADSLRRLEALTDPATMSAASARQAIELHQRLGPRLRTAADRSADAFA
ncbi:MAG: protein kinase [Gemmatimonadales bacterium]